MMWGYPGYGGVGFMHGGVMMLLWPLLLVGLVFLLVRVLRGQPIGCCAPGHVHTSAPSVRANDEAREVLRQRYARGEITKEEYLDIWTTLGH